MSSEDAIRALASEYRGVLVNEIKVHRAYSRFVVVTGIGLIVLGLALSSALYDLGLLLALLGLIRTLNSAYDFTRKDRLQRALARIEVTADKSQPAS